MGRFARAKGSASLRLNCPPLEILEHLDTIACDQREMPVPRNHSAQRSWGVAQQPAAVCERHRQVQLTLPHGDGYVYVVQAEAPGLGECEIVVDPSVEAAFKGTANHGGEQVSVA